MMNHNRQPKREYIDGIVNASRQFSLSVESMDNGDVVIHWPIQQPTRRLTRMNIADALGMDHSILGNDGGMISYHILVRSFYG
jgi:hypothetical protein